MKLDKLNQWLTLLANVGVLVGLFFLIAELNQSNRIAVYSAESNRTSQFLYMNTTRIENPEVIVKLMERNPEFSDEEWVQAIYTARQQVNTWIDAENAVINGLLSDTTYKAMYADIDVVIAEMPGLIPAFEYLFRAYGIDENHEFDTLAYLFTAVGRYKKVRINQTPVEEGD